LYNGPRRTFFRSPIELSGPSQLLLITLESSEERPLEAKKVEEEEF